MVGPKKVLPGLIIPPKLEFDFCLYKDPFDNVYSILAFLLTLLYLLDGLYYKEDVRFYYN
jgi:hypothetical protein